MEYEDNYPGSFDEYLKLAEADDADAQELIGWFYFTGTRVACDYNKSEYWLLRADSMGNQTAGYYLGKLYSKRGDESLASSWFEKAARKGYAPAMYNFGRRCQLGKGVEKNVRKAFSLFKEGYKKGNLFSQKSYSIMLIKGYGGLWGVFKGFFLYLNAIWIIISMSLSKDELRERMRN